MPIPTSPPKYAPPVVVALPKSAAVAKRFVDDAVVAKKFVEVALVRVLFKAVSVVRVPVEAKRFVDDAVVAKKFVEVALVSVVFPVMVAPARVGAFEKTRSPPPALPVSSVTIPASFAEVSMEVVLPPFLTASTSPQAVLQ